MVKLKIKQIFAKIICASFQKKSTNALYALQVPSKYILPVDRLDPEVVAMLTSGLTASIALEKAAQMDSGKVVFVTAATGGTGQFAVQLAKLAGNTVVATCGGKEKAAA